MEIPNAARYIQPQYTAAATMITSPEITTSNQGPTWRFDPFTGQPVRPPPASFEPTTSTIRLCPIIYFQQHTMVELDLNLIAYS
ncbi:hypothetical protein M5689_022853 [Euphorbia peplus]|nr:hypothetical protein M5689_022853 [Euphorbia peplus]